MADLKTEKPTAEAVSPLPVLPGVAPAGSSGSENATPTLTDASSAFAASIPQVGAYRTEDHRYYWNGKGPLPSVTSIIGVLDKPAVVQWAKRTVAEIAVKRWEELGSVLHGERQKVADFLYGIRSIEDGVVVDIPPAENQVLALGEPNSEQRIAAAIRWLAGMPDYQADTAAKLGSSVHLLADMASRASESDSETFQLSEQEKPYLVSFSNFLRHLRGSGGQIISSEKMVWSEQGYAGTYDLLVRMDGALWLLDIKTSKGYYPEYALQLIAYGYADWIIVEGNPMGYPMPLPDRYGVLHLRPDQYPDTGWRLVEYPLIEADYMAFLGALEIWRWKQEKRYTKAILNPDKKARKG